MATLLFCLACSPKGEKALEFHSEADLPGVVLATSAGNYYDQKFSQWEGITLLRANTDADCVQALTQGLADVFVTDEVVLSEQEHLPGLPRRGMFRRGLCRPEGK